MATINRMIFEASFTKTADETVSEFYAEIEEAWRLAKQAVQPSSEEIENEEKLNVKGFGFRPFSNWNTDSWRS